MGWWSPFFRVESPNRMPTALARMKYPSSSPSIFDTLSDMENTLSVIYWTAG